MDGLTDLCSAAVGELSAAHGTAWPAIVEQCRLARHPGNVEDVLSNVRMKIDAIAESEVLVGLDRDQLCEMEVTIRTTIAKAACPREATIPDRVPHDDFADWVRRVNRTAPLEVFTTNYDVLFERAFERSRVPVFDGFVGAHRPFFFPECVDDDGLLPTAKWIRLWKLHGSVNWSAEGEDGRKRIVRTQPSESGEMILPSYRKYDESRKLPYVAYMDRLTRLLGSEHALLITCGYSFGDEHINSILYGALDNQHTANVIALQYDALDQTDQLVREAARRFNLTVIGPNGAVISGTWGPWQLLQPVDHKTHAFMDVAFDSNASPEEGGSAAATSDDLKGRMRLVDFNRFSSLLVAMGAGSSG